MSDESLKPWCRSCEHFLRGACSRSGDCLWREWSDGIVYNPEKNKSGGTGQGFPAVVRREGGWIRAWLKCQQRGKTGGYSWEQICKAFSYEVRALAFLDEKGSAFVPQVLCGDDIVRRDGTDWIWYAMTRAEGKDFDKCYLNGYRRPLFALCEALVALHRSGFGHYDLKPQNIKYNEKTGTVCLIDLGSSKGPEDWRSQSEKNRNHPFVEENMPGTKPYVSPEHRTKRLRELTPVADDYVFGVIFCQAVLGRIVRPDESRSDLLRELREAGLDEAISEIVARRLLSVDSAYRYGALDDLFGELRRQGWNRHRRAGKLPAVVLLVAAAAAAAAALHNGGDFGLFRGGQTVADAPQIEETPVPAGARPGADEEDSRGAGSASVADNASAEPADEVAKTGTPEPRETEPSADWVKKLAAGKAGELRAELKAALEESGRKQIALDFYRKNAASLLPSLTVADAPAGTLVRLRGEKDWRSVSSDPLKYELPPGWAGGSFNLTVDFKGEGECKECYPEKNMPQSIDPFTNTVTVTCPDDLTNGNDKPCFRLNRTDLAPDGAKVVWRYLDGAKENIPWDQTTGICEVEPHRRFAVSVSAKGHAPYVRAYSPVHLGADMSLGKISLVREPEGPFLRDIPVNRIIVCEKDGKYEDAEVREAAGENFTVEHVNLKVKPYFEFALSGELAADSWVKLGKNGGLTVAGAVPLALSDGYDAPDKTVLRFDASERTDGEIHVVRNVGIGIADDLTRRWDSLLGNPVNRSENRKTVLGELESLAKNSAFRDVAARYYAETEELHPVVKLRSKEGSLRLRVSAADGTKSADVGSGKAEDFGRIALKFGETAERRFKVLRKCTDTETDCAVACEVVISVPWNHDNEPFEIGEADLTAGGFRDNPVVVIPDKYVNAGITGVTLGGAAIPGADVIEANRRFRVEPHTRQKLQLTFSNYEPLTLDIGELHRGQEVTLDDKAELKRRGKPPVPSAQFPAPARDDMVNLCYQALRDLEYDLRKFGELKPEHQEVGRQFFEHVKNSECSQDVCRSLKRTGTGADDEALWAAFRGWCEDNRDPNNNMKIRENRQIRHDGE